MTNCVPAKVLLVDNEPMQLDLCSRVLMQPLVPVVTASGPIQAISIVEEALEKIDVAILDYDMTHTTLVVHPPSRETRYLLAEMHCCNQHAQELVSDSPDMGGLEWLKTRLKSKTY